MAGGDRRSQSPLGHGCSDRLAGCGDRLGLRCCGLGNCLGHRFDGDFGCSSRLARGLAHSLGSRGVGNSLGLGGRRNFRCGLGSSFRGCFMSRFRGCFGGRLASTGCRLGREFHWSLGGCFGGCFGGHLKGHLGGGFHGRLDRCFPHWFGRWFDRCLGRGFRRGSGCWLGRGLHGRLSLGFGLRLGHRFNRFAICFAARLPG